MAVRPLTERVEEVKQKRDKAQKRLAQYDEQIKRMEKQAIEEERKARTHKLIVSSRQDGLPFSTTYHRSCSLHLHISGRYW